MVHGPRVAQEEAGWLTHSMDATRFQQVAEIFCCGERECPPGSAEDCFDVMCQPQLQTLFTCGLSMAPTSWPCKTSPST